MSEQAPEVVDRVANLFGAAAIARANAGTLERDAAASLERAKSLRVEAATADAEARALLKKPCGCSEAAASNATVADVKQGRPPAPTTKDTRKLSLEHVHGLRGSFGRALAGMGVTTLEQLAAKTEAELRAGCPGGPQTTFANGIAAAAKAVLEARGMKLAEPVVGVPALGPTITIDTAAVPAEVEVDPAATAVPSEIKEAPVNG